MLPQPSNRNSLVNLYFWISPLGCYYYIDVIASLISSPPFSSAWMHETLDSLLEMYYSSQDDKERDKVRSVVINYARVVGTANEVSGTTMHGLLPPSMVYFILFSLYSSWIWCISLWSTIRRIGQQSNTYLSVCHGTFFCVYAMSNSCILTYAYKTRAASFNCKRNRATTSWINFFR